MNAPRPQIRVVPDGPSEGDADELRTALQRDLGDYQIKIVSRGGIRGRSPSAPEEIAAYLPQVAVSLASVVIEKWSGWAWKRWKSRRGP